MSKESLNLYIVGVEKSSIWVTGSSIFEKRKNTRVAGEIFYKITRRKHFCISQEIILNKHN